jgi:hypothetical protein
MLESLELILEQLADEDRPVRSIDLNHLSDLPRSEVMRLVLGWEGLSAARRFGLVSLMVEQAEVNIHLNFHSILRECLTDSDGRIRRLAIDGLWEDEKPSLIEPLAVRLAEDSEAEVRAAAATSLGRFVLLGALGEIAEIAALQAERSLHAAWARVHESIEVRRRALESLASAANPVVSELIAAGYDDDDELMRQSAIFAMGRSADRRWSKMILAELGSRNPAMRYEAALSAGELGLSGAVVPLIQLLNDVDANVREAAALALGKIGGGEARRALEEALNGDDERLAQAAEDALEELAFNSSGFEPSGESDSEESEGHDRGSRQWWDAPGDEAEDEDFYEEDEDDWDIGEDDERYWLDEEGEEEEEEGEDLFPGMDSYRGTDSFPGLPRDWRDRPGPV